ncbi:YALI0F12023p [Yarrowia lipolytica CLIB122]|uniref:YALI0F12023p n=2 Tax=Yarrowia lipolytica TaxID=4952 RepID=Q6C1Z9_YARLI|nr:YALI0F12023p [Yarrowia lipolytica CLIB122]AOW07031.1 hypothetical protein YALI1_F15878g [Yarrowia lipolytica]KAB8282204.1 Sec63/Sec62 complex-interacting family-domain-containing protein [Yarrowia lipolytica]KAE8172824.1 Sec63/Sec62 complex-interacting family-domain-containing protein [Yarrowia lipolytica]KAJ8055811.1 Sec63/Sec62 complex-interacting family-domain-containing protein [Yarrowia lipolytica]CAG78120.1 YALI0F12023p [Yarrowia lipolytica CLIB122]|eukprot:XP_505313.1 YALI0F12023p [Yarrowia lipolytica CLIB122]
MNREAREARMRGAGTRKVAPVKLVIHGTTPGSGSSATGGFREQQKEAQTPTPFERNQRRRQTDVLPMVGEVEDIRDGEGDLAGTVQTEPAIPYTLPVRPVSTSPPEFNLTQDFEESPPGPEAVDEDAVDLSVQHHEQFDVSDSDEEFVPAVVSDVELEHPRPPSPPRQSQATRGNYADRIKTFTAEEAPEETPASSRNRSSVRPPRKKRNKGIALEVTQLDTDEPEFSPRVTMVDFVSQMVLETLDQELGKDVDEEQREVIEKYKAELNSRFLELCDINNAVYMQRARVAKLIRTKNTAQEALLKVNENLNGARVETDRKSREYAAKKRTWDDTRLVNEFLHDVQDVNNSLRGVHSSGVIMTPSVFDKLAHIEEQTQLLGKLRQLNGLLEFASQKLSS